MKISRIVTTKPLENLVEYQIEEDGKIISHGWQLVIETGIPPEMTVAELNAAVAADATARGFLS